MSEPKLHKSQNFEIRRMLRSDVREAPYNPRVIDPNARRKLLMKLKRRGLLEPLVWNKKTGNIVSGHQRLGILDQLADGAPDYLLDWSVVDLTPEQEREMVIFFNNPNTQGQYDIDKLLEVFKTPNLKLEETGFERMDIALTWGEDVMKEFFKAPTMHDTEQQPAQVQGDIAKLEEMNKIKADEIQKLKQQRKEFKAKSRAESDTEFYAVVVFKDRVELGQFMVAAGYEAEERYIDGAQFCEMYGIKMEVSKDQDDQASVAVGGK